MIAIVICSLADDFFIYTPVHVNLYQSKEDKTLSGLNLLPKNKMQHLEKHEKYLYQNEMTTDNCFFFFT